MIKCVLIFSYFYAKLDQQNKLLIPSTVHHVIYFFILLVEFRFFI